MCGAGELVAAAAQPDWAGLSQDLWRRIVHPTAAARRESCVRQARLLVTLSTVCRSLRSAVRGPDSGPLWRHLVLSSSHPGLTSQQSRGLNNALAAQGHHAHSLYLFGGAWDLAQLERTTACLTGLRDLKVYNMDAAAEAAVISRTLSCLPITAVHFSGTAACLLPRTALQVELRMMWLSDGAGDFHSLLAEQTPFKRALGCLRPLSSIRVLTLFMLPWLLTSKVVDQLAACHPQLEELHLGLLAASFLGTHAIHSLQRLTSVQLSLTVSALGDDVDPQPSVLAGLLQQLLPLELHTLQILVDAVSPVDEALLARCNLQQLVLQLSDPAQRLQQPLGGGVPVVYEPLQH